MNNLELLAGDCGALVAFNLYVKLGGVQPAAEAMGRTTVALNERLQHLEKQLGVKLIERRKPRPKLTEAGMDLHMRTKAPCAAIVRELRKHQAVGAHPAGPLLVSASAAFAEAFPADEFGARFPDVSLAFTEAQRFGDLDHAGVHAVICEDVPPTASGRSAQLAGSQLLVANPFFPRPTAKGRHQLVQVSRTISREDEVFESKIRVLDPKDGREQTFILEVVWEVNTLLGVALVVKGGQSAAVLPYALVADDLKAGNLVAWGILKAPRKLVHGFRAGRAPLSPTIAGFAAFLGQHYGPNPTFTVFV